MATTFKENEDFYNEYLKGNPNWSLDNRIKATLKHLKKKNDKVRRFELHCNYLRAFKYAEEKIENARINWCMDETYREIEECKLGLMGGPIISEDEMKKQEEIISQIDWTTGKLKPQFVKELESSGDETAIRDANILNKRSITDNPFLDSTEES